MRDRPTECTCSKRRKRKKTRRSPQSPLLRIQKDRLKGSEDEKGEQDQMTFELPNEDDSEDEEAESESCAVTA